MQALQARLPTSWVGHESVLQPAGPQARAVDGLWHFMFAISIIVYIAVMIATAYAVTRARRRMRDERDTAVRNTDQSDADDRDADDRDADDRDADDRDAASRERTMWRAVSACTATTVLVLFAFLLYDFGVGRAVAAPLHAAGTLHINLVGHQWWWEVQYDDTAPGRNLSTADEIHVPVKRPILFTLTSQDVIHSFWMPNLNGKKDLVPGHVNDAWFVADTPGVYRGQCAEFCGLEHAKMVLIVVAEPEAQFNRWYDQQLTDAAAPSDSDRAAGKRVFLAVQCAMCHSIQGTAAGAHFGPDLTHVGSRLMLAAGTVPNTPGNLGGWIMNPQSIKPGANMPANNLEPKQLRSLIAYLEGLK